MDRSTIRKYKLIDGFTDAGLVYVSFMISSYIRFVILNAEDVNRLMRLFVNKQGIITMFYSVIMMAVYYFIGRYENIRRKKLAGDVLSILAANAIGTLFYTAIIYFAYLPDFSRIAIALFFLLSTVLVAGKRVILVEISRIMLKNGYNRRHVIVVGSGRLASGFALETENEQNISTVIDGYIADMQNGSIGNYLGDYSQIYEILMESRVDEVIIALEPDETIQMSDTITACENSGLRASIIPYYNSYLPSNPKIENYGSCKLINIRTIPLDNPGWAFYKRFGDIVLSAMALIVLSPVFLFTAVGVKLSSPGPVFFCQKRMGKDKKVFSMYKFRSMPTNVDHNGWTTAVDSRRTPFGSFIRKFSIDELPQFWNVLIGDMSLVGPRPELPNFVFKFSEDIPRYLVRQQVRPGITGLAQINGFRGDTSISGRVEYDIKYIEEWSWLLDIKILIKTALGGFINQERKDNANG